MIETCQRQGLAVAEFGHARPQRLRFRIVLRHAKGPRNSTIGVEARLVVLVASLSCTIGDGRRGIMHPRIAQREEPAMNFLHRHSFLWRASHGLQYRQEFGGKPGQILHEGQRESKKAATRGPT